MGDIKSRFVLEGEQQFRSAMTNAKNSLKVLNAEQKLATAQFKNTGDAEKYASEQARILKEKIEQQKNAVKAAEQAIKQLNDNGVEKSSRKLQEWQTRLLSAQTALTDMETELQNVTGGLNETTSAAQETTGALEAIGKKVSFDAVIGGIGKVTDAISSAATKAIELGSNLVNGMKEASDWADDLATQANIYGISTTQLQQMQFTADIIDTSVEAIMKSRQKLANNMVKGSDEVKEALDGLGVSLYETVSPNGKFGGVEGQMRGWEDVFWEAGEALLKLTDYEEANARATKLFGRSWEQLRPLFDNGWDSPDNYLAKQFPELYGDYQFSSAKEYYDAVMASWNTTSDENVSKLTELNDSLQRVENEFETLKSTVLANLAPAFTDVANAISQMLSSLNEYLQTDEGQKKMEALGEAVKKLFDSMTNVDFGNVVDFAENVLTKLTEGLEWLANNWSGVEFAIKTIAAAFALMTISQPVLTALQLLASGKFLLGGFGNNTTTTTPTTTTGGMPVPIKTGRTDTPLEEGKKPTLNNPDALAYAKIALGKAAEMLATYDPAGSTALAGEVIKDKTAFGNALKNGGSFFDAQLASSKAIIDWFGEVGKNTSDWWNTRVGAAHTSVEAIKQFGEGIWESIAGIFGQVGEQLTAEQLREKYADYVDENGVNKLFDENGELKIQIHIEPEEDAAETVSQEVGVVEIPAKLIPFGTNWISPSFTGGAGAGGKTLMQFHANGLPYVPFDGYPAILHRGERVMSAREVAASRNFNSNLYVESMYMSNGMDAEALAAAMAAANKRVMTGFGS